MRIIKANSLIKKISLALILALVLLVTSVSVNGFTAKQPNASPYNAPGTLNFPLYEAEAFYNIVILTNLSGAPSFSGQDLTIIDKAFNDETDPNVKSVKEYFLEQSGGSLNITSVYMFCNSLTTENGFKELNSTTQTNFVNSALNGDVYKNIDKSERFTNNDYKDLDANNDGIIDSVTLYTPLTIDNDDYDTAAWPHAIISDMPFNHTFKNLRYNRFVILSYKYFNGILMTAPIGVMCHEMLHNIGHDAGIQDLYHYPENPPDPDFEYLHPVGSYCIMGATDYQTPQPLNIYYKSKLGWAELIDVESGEAMLSKTEAKGIKFGARGFEFFVAQFWKDPGFGSNRDGIIIYRVNTAILTGNMNKTGDEIYIFRKIAYVPDQYGRDFPAVFKNNEVFKELKYSDGDSADITVKTSVGSNSVSLRIERYSLRFRINGEAVPYEIDVQLTDGAWEKTFGGTYVFSHEDIETKSINFECFGYEFYKYSDLTQRITSVNLREYNLTEENFTIIVYVKAIPRNITAYFKNFEGNALTINLDSIDYNFNSLSGNFDVIDFTVEFSESENFQLKNGDKIYFKLDGYEEELLEITPDVIEAKNINLRRLCMIIGAVTSRGTPLPNVQIFINGEYVDETDSEGHFILENIPQGAILSFELEDYKINDFVVIQDENDLSILAKNLLENSWYVLYIASAIIGVVIIVTLISVFAGKKKRSYTTNEYYDE